MWNKTADKPNRRLGQASIECLLLLFLVAVLLWDPIHDELVPALKLYYQSMVYPLSLP